MLILVLCRAADGIEEAGFRRYLPAETAALRELKADGVLADAWSPGRPGAVLLLNVPGQAEAAAIAAVFGCLPSPRPALGSGAFPALARRRRYEMS